MSMKSDITTGDKDQDPKAATSAKVAPSSDLPWWIIDEAKENNNPHVLGNFFLPLIAGSFIIHPLAGIASIILYIYREKIPVMGWVCSVMALILLALCKCF